MKRALLVGVDTYAEFGDLHGCVNDVEALRPLLSRNHDRTINFNCQARVEPSETSRDSLLNDVRRLLGPGAEVALLYFAGHGHGSGDDVSLCVSDGTEAAPGLPLSQVLGEVRRSAVPEVIIVLDCCFSGAAGGCPQLGSGVSVLREGVTILAASRSDQAAMETAEGRGRFSSYLCGGLEGGAADVLGRVTVASLYAYLDESFGPWDQRPIFRSNLERLHHLRTCPPALNIDYLRDLPRLFTTAECQLALDSSYEPTAEPRSESREADFALLQAARAAKLVEPVDEEHLYFAAINGGACRLTPLGKHYWSMATQSLL
ncbi:MAG: caspase family protein [Microthrixaceae bacterium]